MKYVARAALAIGVLAISASLCVAENKSEAPIHKRPIGAWEKKIGDNSIVFDIAADTIKATVKTPDGTLTISSEYALTKDGSTLYGVIRNVEKKGVCAGPSEGDMFNFHFKVDKDTLTIKDLKGSTDSEEARQLVEGEYKAVDKKK